MGYCGISYSAMLNLPGSHKYGYSGYCRRAVAHVVAIDHGAVHIEA